MPTRIRDEKIFGHWAAMIEGGAAHWDELLGDLAGRIEDAFSGDARPPLVEVSLGNGLGAPLRQFLDVRHRTFRDLRIFLGARPYGEHVELLRLIVVATPWWKRCLATALSRGEWWAWSVPRGVAQEQEVRAWLTSVHHELLSGAKAFAERHGGSVRAGSSDPLEDWQ